jgi:hypothetical protein
MTTINPADPVYTVFSTSSMVHSTGLLDNNTVTAPGVGDTDRIEISRSAIELYQKSTMAGSTPVYTVAQALSLAGSAAAGSLTIADSSANLKKNYDRLVAINGAIGAITQTDQKALGLTEAQFSAGVASAQGLLRKINSGNFSVAVSGVHVSNLSAIASFGTQVVALSIADSSAQIASKLSEIDALGSKVTTLTQTQKSSMALSYADVLKYAEILKRIDKGAYSLNINDNAATIQTNLLGLGKLGAKVAAITQTDATTALQLDVKQLSTHLKTLNKINQGNFKVQLEDTSSTVSKAWNALVKIQPNISQLSLTDGTPALRLNAVQAGAGGGLLDVISNASFGLAVTDKAVNLSSNLSRLLAMNDKITQLTQSDRLNLAVSTAQLNNGAMTSFLGKFGSGSPGLLVTGVQESSLLEVLANDKVKAVALQLSTGSLSAADEEVNAALSHTKITAIAISNVKIADASALTADKRVNALSIKDSAANLADVTQLDTLHTLMKSRKGLVTAIESDAESRSLITVNQASYIKYASTIYSAQKNYSLQVDMSVAVDGLTSLTENHLRNAFKTTANKDGTFSVQTWKFQGGGYNKAVKFNPGVNLLKIGTVSTFLDTGDAKLNSVLNVGTFQWQQNPARSDAGISSYELKPGVFSLSAGSAKQVINYKFLTDVNDPSLGTASDKKGFEAMSADQKASVTAALNYISSLVNIEFKMVDSGADINFGTNDQGSVSAGYATGANPAMSPTGSVNLLLNNRSGGNNLPAPGNYAWETLIHEIGHNLGLKHPGAYNAGGGAAAGPYLSREDDNRRNTVMSYKSPADGKNWTPLDNGSYTYSSVNANTFMPLDILALQFLYGKNTTGTSRMDETQGLANFQTTQFTSSWLGMQTLSSTVAGLSLDMSGVSASNILDLRAGAFSSINIKPPTYNAGIGSGSTAQAFYNYNNVGLAYDACITDLMCGSGRDVVFVGQNDVSIDGGEGDDMVYLHGSASEWSQSADGEVTTYTNGVLSARLKNIEAIGYYEMATRSFLHTALDLSA